MTRFLVVLMALASLPVAAGAETRAVRSFAHSVTNTAARVEPPNGNKSYVSIRCWNPATTPVYVGGKDVTTRNGFAICTEVPSRGAPHDADAGWTCSSDVISLDVDDLYAVTGPPVAAPKSPALQSLSCLIVQ